MVDPMIGKTVDHLTHSETYGTLAGLMKMWLENESARFRDAAIHSIQSLDAMKALEYQSMASAYNNTLMILENLAQPGGGVMYETSLEDMQKLDPDVHGRPICYAVWPVWPIAP